MRVLRIARDTVLSTQRRRAGLAIAKKAALDSNGTLIARNSHRVLALKGLKLFYSPVAKAGSTSTALFLRDIAASDGGGESERLVDLDAKTLAGCATWTKFTVVRNPYDRVLSAYLGKVRNPKYASIPGFQSEYREGFGQFLDYLLGGRSNNHHFTRQVDLLAWNVSDFDHVVRLEEFADQFPKVLRSVGFDPPTDVDFSSRHEADIPRIPPPVAPRLATERRRLFYSSRLAAIVAQIYLEDFEQLGYPLGLEL